MLDSKLRRQGSQVFRWIPAFLVVSFLCPPGHAGPLKLNGPTSRKGYRVKTVFEVTGKLLTKDRSNASPTEHPLEVQGEHLFEEQVLDADTGRSLRYYQQAKAEFVVDGRANSTQLRDQMRWIVVEPGESDVTYSSPLGPLTRRELELIEVPGASNLINRLLPEVPISVEEKWQPSEQMLARLLALDNVTANEVQCQVTAVEDETVRMSISGKLIGSIRGVVTDLELTGKFNYSRKDHRIVWVALAINENREIGLSTPGLKVRARLRMVIGPDAVMQNVDRGAVDRFGQAKSKTETLLEYTSDTGDFAILHDRRWHVFTERSTMTVLRCVEDDRMIAQCNLQMLPALGESLTMTKFQNDIQQVLADSLNEIVDTQESTTAKGDQVLRVVASGTVSSAPIQWIYYHVTHQDGRRLSCVFTMSADDIESFGGEDLELIESLSFLSAEEQAKVTAARDEARR